MYRGWGGGGAAMLTPGCTSLSAHVAVAIYMTNLIIEEVGGYDSQIPGGIPNQPDTVAFPMRVLMGIVPAVMILISVAL